MGNRGNRIVLLAVAIGLAFTGSVYADENVRVVQEKLRDDGFYVGKIDGDYSTELAAALSRYQIVNGLPITGQLDADTAKALGAKPAVASSNDQARISETWQGLRKSDWEFLAKLNARRATPSPAPDGNETGNTAGTPPRSAPAATAPGAQVAQTSPHESPLASAPIALESGTSASPPPAAVTSEKLASPLPATVDSSPASDVSEQRLRDYVGAFVLAGLDPNVGSEADFFANRVQYYNQGTKDREKIRADLKRYDSRWPGRKFWLAGDISVEPQSDKRMRVTFPLRYELRNGAKRASGKIKKTLVLEPTGDDLQIVAVNERNAE
jgi:peptidoglycan hydrolase-like protein with peptidoglycan-binding domain